MLDLSSLTKRYPSFALGPLSLTVRDEVMAVLGPSGSGKTTLLSLISGTERPDGGHVRLHGRDLSAEPIEARGTARVFQEGTLFPHLTARENVEYAADPSARPDELAARLEIDGILDQPARTLSGGERRRVEVARALAAAPDVLLLDEPTSGLDPPVRRRLRSRLRTLLTALHIPVIYVTHDQEEASVVADRVAVLKDGRLQQVGAPAAVFARPKTPFVARFTGNPNVLPARLTGEGGSLRVAWAGRTLTVPETALPAETDVWLCVRPEQVQLQAPGDDADSTNVLDGSVERAVRRGGAYVVELHPSGGAQGALLTATVLPPTYRTLDLAPGRRVRIRLAPEALHLIRRTH